MVFSKKCNSFICAVLFILSVPVMANSEVVTSGGYNSGLIALSSSLCICIASSVGALSQSGIAKNALEGMARNPEAAGKLFVPLILSLALIESLVLFSLLVSLSLVGKIA